MEFSILPSVQDFQMAPSRVFPREDEGKGMETERGSPCLCSIREAPLGFTVCVGITLELYLGKRGRGILTTKKNNLDTTVVEHLLNLIH